MKTILMKEEIIVIKKNYQYFCSFRSMEQTSICNELKYTSKTVFYRIYGWRLESRQDTKNWFISGDISAKLK